MQHDGKPSQGPALPLALLFFLFLFTLHFLLRTNGHTLGIKCIFLYIWLDFSSSRTLLLCLYCFLLNNIYLLGCAMKYVYDWKYYIIHCHYEWALSLNERKSCTGCSFQQVFSSWPRQQWIFLWKRENNNSAWILNVYNVISVLHYSYYNAHDTLLTILNRCWKEKAPQTKKKVLKVLYIRHVKVFSAR